MAEFIERAGSAIWGWQGKFFAVQAGDFPNGLAREGQVGLWQGRGRACI